MMGLAVPTANAHPECVATASASQKDWVWDLHAVPILNVYRAGVIKGPKFVDVEGIATVLRINSARPQDVLPTELFVKSAPDHLSVLRLRHATAIGVWRHERPEIWEMHAVRTDTARAAHAVWLHLISANARRVQLDVPTPINFVSLVPRWQIITHAWINWKLVNLARPPGNVRRQIRESKNLRHNASEGCVSFLKQQILGRPVVGMRSVKRENVLMGNVCAPRPPTVPEEKYV
jgi:hypothetical protein